MGVGLIHHYHEEADDSKVCTRHGQSNEQCRKEEHNRSNSYVLSTLQTRPRDHVIHADTKGLIVGFARLLVPVAFDLPN